ncbi:hypothetical protein FOIG_00307 [Fusarium odoratissimum NRRL 54006]|uniref:Uncharacterized protein n=1 Tax=Fusarium odoratissimum (strain NRRL 54006) TaxID=1089451 RepID=X0K8Z3_FUSO5|nr:uncharacterized protein FOIG_00307 [Fusarium odoratissimum NRRL 54006]EXM10064.1 hypothetical protein FOIG_00307 [Fusarium odoratissimum NRRL 54006]
MEHRSLVQGEAGALSRQRMKNAVFNLDLEFFGLYFISDAILMSELDTASYVHVVARVYYTGFYVTSDFQFIRLGANANYNQETLSQDSQTILDEVFGRHTYTHTSAIEAGLRGLSGAFVINWHKL